MSMNSFHARQGRPRPATATQPPAQHGNHSLLRADLLLVAQGLAASRTAARQMIEAGRVRYQGAVLSKAAQKLPADTCLRVIADDRDRFVSRGALKLAAALEHCALEVAGRICLDIGQSTGGFSDCLLQAGAQRVIGVEVGHGQLHPRLRADPRCVCIEGCNARQLSAAGLGAHFPPAGFDLLVCDASFISLTLLLPQWPALLAVEGNILALVKPQFEVGAGKLGKGGIVRDASHYAAVEARLRAAAQAAGLDIVAWFESALRGGDGNREFFFHARLGRQT